jgi:hypothetical protein
MPKLNSNLDLMILGYRAMIRRCDSRAEPLVLSPKQFIEFLDLLEAEREPQSGQVFRVTKAEK